MIQHPDTLCGSIAQFVPLLDFDEKNETMLLYVNGRALLEPFPHGVGNFRATENIKHNPNPTHVTPRQIRTANKKSTSLTTRFPQECLIGLGSTLLPTTFQSILQQRRLFFNAITTNKLSNLETCRV